MSNSKQEKPMTFLFVFPMFCVLLMLYAAFQGGFEYFLDKTFLHKNAQIHEDLNLEIKKLNNRIEKLEADHDQ